MNPRILAVASARRATQLFNMLSMVAVTLMPAFLLSLTWSAGSKLVYATSTYPPNPIFREHIGNGGYHFHGSVGALLGILSFSNELKKFFSSAQPMWLAILVFGFLVVVPFGLRNVWHASKEKWRNMPVAAM